MRNCGFVGVGVLGLVLCGTASSAQDFGRYREFELGSDVAVVSTVTGTFRLVVTAEPIAALVRTAVARALVLDAREAPQREAAREKKAADDRQAAEEKVRSTNKATFRP